MLDEISFISAIASFPARMHWPNSSFKCYTIAVGRIIISCYLKNSFDEVGKEPNVVACVEK